MLLVFSRQSDSFITYYFSFSCRISIWRTFVIQLCSALTPCRSFRNPRCQVYLGEAEAAVFR